MPSGGLRVRPATHGDVAFAAQLHARLLPHGLFVHLGGQVLELYHRGFVDSPFAVALVAEHQGEPAGFLLGTLRNGRHYRWMVRTRGVGFATRAGLALLRRPRVLARFVAARLPRYARALRRIVRPDLADGAASGHGGPGGPTAVLTHVAIAPTAQGHRVGTTLTEHFLAAADRSGAAAVQLITRAGEEGAAEFYRRHGWELVGEHTDLSGKTDCVFRWPLPGGSPPG